jgi:hypothetical protein
MSTSYDQAVAFLQTPGLKSIEQLTQLVRDIRVRSPVSRFDTSYLAAYLVFNWNDLPTQTFSKIGKAI